MNRSGNPKSRFHTFQFETLEARLLCSATPNAAANLIAAQPSALIGLPRAPSSPAQPAAASASPSSSLLSPVQIRHAYGLDNVSNNGAGQTIAIIDPFNDPKMQSDLNVFDQKYGLPALQLNIQQETLGYVPGFDAAWARETALDVEWAHAIAPGAKIALYEANSASLADFLATVDLARNDPSVSVISMSYENSTSVAESNTNYHFTTPTGHIPITFIASSGDNGSGAVYPAGAPNVLAVGGTTLNLYNGNYGSESAWSQSGGGIDHYETKPAYQSAITFSNNRILPDVAFDADLASGVNVYHSAEGGWVGGGGTSLGAPAWAGMIAIANQGRAAIGRTTLGSTIADLYAINSYDFEDVVVGSNGDYKAQPGYDMVTGLGTPNALFVIADLVKAEPPQSTHVPITTGPIIAAASASTATAPQTTGQTANASAATLGKPADAVAVDQVLNGETLVALRQGNAAATLRPFAWETRLASANDRGGLNDAIDALVRVRLLERLQG